ncbi:helix-turn-helix domain-containing protein [Flavobacterium silvaticum]|uniref:Helix-turn-helix transcriptional regulator n=1 Tax=Flavobacterium silvaticum TaxID=1852020 RepID=A0A972FTM5_9FLAO|nr:helix-turn-helix transcriptional regulator [Flavobacterium silvaticum]NMH29104.1 helix-turn-helix transcriptional regulator [Flavobacterium silvaticum]
MKEMLKEAREAIGLKQHEVARLLKIDPALLSKFESGQRMPTRDQIENFAELYQCDRQELVTRWLTQKLLDTINEEPLATKALKRVLSQLDTSETESAETDIQKVLREMEAIKAELRKK